MRQNELAIVIWIKTSNPRIEKLNGLVDDARDQTRKTTALEEAFAAVRKEVNRNSRAVDQLREEIEHFKVD